MAMLCKCSGEQFKLEEMPRSPESLATRDYSANASSSRVGDFDSKFDDDQVDEVESALRDTISLNYEVPDNVCEPLTFFWVLLASNKKI
jgi:tetratricopeptide repeat protein 7